MEECGETIAWGKQCSRQYEASTAGNGLADAIHNGTPDSGGKVSPPAGHTGQSAASHHPLALAEGLKLRIAAQGVEIRFFVDQMPVLGIKL